MRRSIRLLTASFPGDPALDTAVSRALLQAVAAGQEPESLRIHRPGEVVAFSLLDRASRGFPRALAEARRLRVGAVLRLAGGRAALFHRGTLSLAWCLPAADSRAGIRSRFEQLSQILRDALQSLGVDARIGPVPGEWCPGAHSISAGGRAKLMGVGQRVVRGAAHLGAVVVVDGSERMRAVLEPIYRALGLDFDPRVVGSIADEVGGISLEEVESAIRRAFQQRFELLAGPLPAALRMQADALAADHRLAGP